MLFSGLGDPSSVGVSHPNPFPPSRRGPGIPCSTPCLAKGISAPASQSPLWPRCISMVPESHPWAGAGTRRQKKSRGVGWVGGEGRWCRQEEEDLSCVAGWPLRWAGSPQGLQSGSCFSPTLPSRWRRMLPVLCGGTELRPATSPGHQGLCPPQLRHFQAPLSHVVSLDCYFVLAIGKRNGAPCSPVSPAPA